MREYNTTLDLEINTTEQDFLNEVLSKLDEIKEIFGSDIIDTRDICEKIEELDEISNNIREYNDDNIDNEDEDDVLNNSISDDFISMIEKRIEIFKDDELCINELEYIDDFQYGVTLYLESEVDIIGYLDDMGYKIPDFIRGHINKESLMDDMIRNEIDIFGFTYVVL